MRHAKWLCWLSAFVVCLFAERGQTQDKKDDKPKAGHQRWAILIGVDDYAQAQDLQYCGADQRAFRERLIKSGFDGDNVFLLHDDAKEKKYLPFKVNIEKQLDLVLGLLEKDDIVVLAFSGHGLHFGGKSYICPTDAKLDDPNSLVSMDSVYDRLKKSPAAFKLVVVDACRNDPRPGGQRSLTPTDGTRQFAQALERPPEGLVLLNSCAPGEISWEEKDFGHGVFMHFLMDGLSGQADENGDGKVSLSELSQYASRKTKLHVAKKFNDSQRPFLKGDLTLEAMDFDFGKGVAKVSTTPEKPMPLPKNTPLPAEGNLIARIDLDQAAIEGIWTRQGGLLASPTAPFAQLKLADRTPANYRFEFQALRRIGKRELVIGLPVGTSQAMLTLNDTCALSAVTSNKNAATVRPFSKMFSMMRPFRIDVRPNRLLVTCDGREVLDWSGDAKELSVPDPWKLTDRGCLFLGTLASEFEFSKVSVSRLTE